MENATIKTDAPTAMVCRLGELSKTDMPLVIRTEMEKAVEQEPSRAAGSCLF